MEELYKNLDIVKENLDNLKIFDDLDKCLKNVKSNKELMEKIEKYNITKDENLRLDIYNYDEIKAYKKIENEINLLILQVNQKLKKIKDSRSCCHESN